MEATSPDSGRGRGGAVGGGGRLGANSLSPQRLCCAAGPRHLPFLPSPFLVNSLGCILLVPHISVHCLEHRFLRLTQLAIFHWFISWIQKLYSSHPHLFRTSEKIFKLKSHFINVLGSCKNTWTTHSTILISKWYYLWRDNTVTLESQLLSFTPLVLVYLSSKCNGLSFWKFFLDKFLASCQCW